MATLLSAPFGNENQVPLFFGEPSGQQRHRIMPQAFSGTPLQDLTQVASNVMNVTSRARPSPLRWRLQGDSQILGTTPIRPSKILGTSNTFGRDSSTVLLRKGFR